MGKSKAYDDFFGASAADVLRDATNYQSNAYAHAMTQAQEREFLCAVFRRGLSITCSKFVSAVHVEMLAEPHTFETQLRVMAEVRIPNDPNNRVKHVSYRHIMPRGSYHMESYTDREHLKELVENIARQVDKEAAAALADVLWDDHGHDG